ncbi:MAG: AI-2E family transporter [Clostridia bacterium]|nr:AI-2E family transporter [Clostridia bacterium]
MYCICKPPIFFRCWAADLICGRFGGSSGRGAEGSWKKFGLHPVFALFATFAGWYLFGFLGMLISPIVAVLIKLLLESGKTEKLL